MDQAAMGNERVSSPAIVLICNKLYILPTLSTALSARDNINAVDTQIYIYVVDADPDWSSEIDALTSKSGVSVCSANLPELEELSIGHVDRHLPPVVLARFFIHKLLPDHIDRFLYLDGDMMVSESLDSLLATLPPEDGAIVAPDNLQIFGHEFSRSTFTDEKYFSNIHTCRDRYFNSGMIYSMKASWVNTSREAEQFLRKNRAVARSSDQSALNYALRNSAVLVSQRYNYQSEHMMVCDPRKNGHNAVIYHFTGGPKPWDDTGWPWDESFNQYFHEAEKLLEPARLIVERPKAPESQTKEGSAHRRRFRFRQGFLYPWRRARRARALKTLIGRGPV